METDPPINGPESKPATTSIWSRLLNIYTGPGEVFEEVKICSPSAANWTAPALIYTFVCVISSLIIFSQPAILQQIHDQQAATMDQQVKAGKLTQAQADQALIVMDKFMGPTMLKIFGSVSAIFVSLIHIFWWAFILWLMGQLVLKTKFPFMKAVEVAGLTTMILVLGTVVNLLLMVITGKLGITASPALLISDYNLKNKTHVMLAALNVFSFWQVAVSACGLARLTGAPFARALLIVGIYWLAFALFFIIVNMGQFAL